LNCAVDSAAQTNASSCVCARQLPPLGLPVSLPRQILLLRETVRLEDYAESNNIIYLKVGRHTALQLSSLTAFLFFTARRSENQQVLLIDRLYYQIIFYEVDLKLTNLGVCTVKKKTDKFCTNLVDYSKGLVFRADFGVVLTYIYLKHAPATTVCCRACK